jgi:hypothetical protein
MTHYTCSHVGIQGTTHVYLQRLQSNDCGEEIYEARVGVSMMGYTNNHNRSINPFERDFRDNYASGYGTTKEKAMAALRNNIAVLSNGLWS